MFLQKCFKEELCLNNESTFDTLSTVESSYIYKKVSQTDEFIRIFLAKNRQTDSRVFFGAIMALLSQILTKCKKKRLSNSMFN